MQAFGHQKNLFGPIFFVYVFVINILNSIVTI